MSWMAVVRSGLMSGASDVSFGVETLNGVAAKLAMFLFGFVATAYFARELGPATFGGFFLLLSVVQFANRVPHGFGGACQKRLAEADTSNEELLGLTVGVSMASGIVASGLAVLGREQLVSYTGVSNAVPLAVALFVALSLFLPLQFLLAGTGKFGVTNWIDLVREVAKTVLQFGLVALGFGVTGMTVGFVAATVCCLPIILYFLGVRPSLSTRDTVAYVWDYAKFNIPPNVVGKAYTRFDVFLLGAIGLTSAVGFYEVALALTGLATLISGVVMDGLLSKTSDLASRGRSVGETVTATISPLAAAMPAFLAALTPHRVSRRRYRTRSSSNPSITAEVPSVEPPSITSSSRSAYVCERTLSTASPTTSPRWYVGRTTLTLGDAPDVAASASSSRLAASRSTILGVRLAAP